MKLKYSFLSDISIWILCILCICSLNPWPIWHFPYIIQILIILFIGFRLLIHKNEYKFNSIVAIFGVLIFSIIYCQFFLINLTTSINKIFKFILPVIFFLLLDQEENNIFLNRIIKLFSIILAISLPYWIIHFFINLPYSIINIGQYAPFKNYFLFVINTNDDLEWFTRYSSIYVEPGHLGMMCAILLYINNFTLRKWENIVMTISLIWSFSLAGWMLYLIGIFLYILLKSSKILQNFTKILIILFMFITTGFFIYKLEPDSVVSTLIIERLEFDESKGIKGNNRNGIPFTQLYNQLENSDEIWFGKGTGYQFRKYPDAGQSYKNFVFDNGYLGFFNVLFLLGLLLFAFPSRCGLGLILLLLASFIQRPYLFMLLQFLPMIAYLRISYLNKRNLVLINQVL